MYFEEYKRKKNCFSLPATEQNSEFLKIPHNYTGVWEKLMDLWLLQSITQGPRFWGVWGKATGNLLWRSAPPAIEEPHYHRHSRRQQKFPGVLGQHCAVESVLQLKEWHLEMNTCTHTHTQQCIALLWTTLTQPQVIKALTNHQNKVQTCLPGLELKKSQ